MEQQDTTPLPVHQFADENGEVLVVRFVDKNGKSHGGFQHPLTVGETVTEPNWNTEPICGGGIHGWPLNIGMGDGKEPDWSALWQVYGVKPEDVVPNVGGGAKCKFRTGALRYIGDWRGALEFIRPTLIRWTQQFRDNHATGDSSASSATGDSSASSATGNRSASSATGYSSASSATGDSSASSATGNRSASSATGDSSASSATGDSSASSATGYSSASSATGYSSASSATGNRSASSATGYSSASSATGDSSASVVTGLYGRARAGKFGCVSLAWWNSAQQRGEMRCAEIGCGDGSDGKLKADTWYELDDAGRFIEKEA